MSSDDAELRAGVDWCEGWAVIAVRAAEEQRAIAQAMGRRAITALAGHRQGEAFAAFYDDLRAEAERRAGVLDESAREWLRWADSFRGCAAAEAA